MNRAPLDRNLLAHFTGSEHLYSHGLAFAGAAALNYTDGVKYVAETAGAYWLLDLIASAQLDAKVRAEEFQVWKLAVGPKGGAVALCEDGNDKVVYSQVIEWTDFPEALFKLYCTNGTILLPSEY